MMRESGFDSNGQKKSCAFFHEKEEVRHITFINITYHLDHPLHIVHIVVRTWATRNQVFTLVTLATLAITAITKAEGPEGHEVPLQVFLYIRLRTQLKDTSPSSRLIYFELFCNQLVLFPTARTTKRRNLMLVVGNKISVLGGYILPVKSCGFFQGILKAKVL